MWRSLLFIPATGGKFLAKAHQRGADGIILDLEDSIAPDKKAEARDCLAAAIELLQQHSVDIVVRINASWRLAVPDLEAAVVAGVSAIIVPKVSGPGHLEGIDEVVTELELERSLQPGSIHLLGLIETPQALLQVNDIAYASSRLKGLTLGSEDFAMEMGVPPTLEFLRQPYQQVAIAASAAGCPVMGHPGTIAEFRDLAAFQASVELGRALGSTGGMAIHPAQVAVLNEVFTPGADEIAFAERCITAYEEALSAGAGAISMDGKMIDIPVYERARKILAMAKQ